VVHDGRGKDSHGDVHVCIVHRLHGGSKVEVFEITHHALGAGVEMTLLKSSLAVMRSAVLVLTSSV